VLDITRDELAAAGQRSTVPYVWLVFGSEARREQTLRTDQDNGLVYADPPACDVDVATARGDAAEEGGVRRRCRGPSSGRCPAEPSSVGGVVHPAARRGAAPTVDRYEGVAAALGVPVRSRHTAEGDAVVAGRLLMALLPQLQDREI
jgi:hypothetical protein